MGELPRGSHYASAIAADEDLARIVIEQSPAASSGVANPRPPLNEWDEHREALAQIEDRLAIIVAALTGSEPQLAQRPQSALETVRKQITNNKRSALLEQLGVTD